MSNDAGTGHPSPSAPEPGAWPPPAGWTPPYAGPPAYGTLPPYGPVEPAAPPRRPARIARGALVAVPALLVGAGVATVVTLALAGHSGTASAAAAPATTAHHAARHATVGTITSTDGSTWTVATAKGPVSVDIGSRTTFGTTAHPTSESAFHTGEKVRIAGTLSGSTVDASKVAALRTTSTSDPSSSASST